MWKLNNLQPEPWWYLLAQMKRLFKKSEFNVAYLGDFIDIMRLILKILQAYVFLWSSFFVLFLKYTLENQRLNSSFKDCYRLK